MLNLTAFIGNVGGDLEVKVLQSGSKVARFSVAISTYKKAEATEPVWVTCEAWDDLVDRLVKCNVSRGRQIAINGSLALNVFKPKDAPDGKIERRLYVKVGTFQVLGSSKEAEVATVTELPAEPPKSARSRKRA